MLYLTCSMIPSVHLARYGYLVLNNWVSRKRATITTGGSIFNIHFLFFFFKYISDVLMSLFGYC